MKERREKYEQIKPYLPEGRGNEKIDKNALIKEILYMASNVREIILWS